MKDDLDAIKERWADVVWQYEEHATPQGGTVGALFADNQLHIGPVYAQFEKRAILQLAAAAPGDIRTLLGMLAELKSLRVLRTAAVALRDAVRADDIGHQCEAEEALLAAVEELEKASEL